MLHNKLYKTYYQNWQKEYTSVLCDFFVHLNPFYHLTSVIKNTLRYPVYTHKHTHTQNKQRRNEYWNK